MSSSKSTKYRSFEGFHRIYLHVFYAKNLDRKSQVMFLIIKTEIVVSGLRHRVLIGREGGDPAWGQSTS